MSKVSAPLSLHPVCQQLAAAPSAMPAIKYANCFRSVHLQRILNYILHNIDSNSIQIAVNSSVCMSVQMSPMPM